MNYLAPDLLQIISNFSTFNVNKKLIKVNTYISFIQLPGKYYDLLNNKVLKQKYYRNLKILDIKNKYVTDINHLIGLQIILGGTYINDISALTKLKVLDITSNKKIKDISNLKDLKFLMALGTELDNKDICDKNLVGLVMSSKMDCITHLTSLKYLDLGCVYAMSSLDLKKFDLIMLNSYGTFQKGSYDDKYVHVMPNINVLREYI